MDISFRLNQFTWVKFVKKWAWLSPAAITASKRGQSKSMYITSHNVLWNPRPFLIVSNLKLAKFPRLHWTIPDASPESFLSCSIELRSGLTKLTWFILASAHNRWFVKEGHIGYWTKLTSLDENEWKSIVWNLSFLEMTPCLYTVVQHELG